MKRTSLAVLAALALVGALFASVMQPAIAQPQHSFRTTVIALTTANAASGAASSTRGITVPKTYQVTGTTVSGTGTAVVSIQGSNDGSNWDTIGSAVTLSLGTASTSGGFDSDNRYMYVRPNATTLTGTGAKYSATMGF